MQGRRILVALTTAVLATAALVVVVRALPDGNSATGTTTDASATGISGTIDVSSSPVITPTAASAPVAVPALDTTAPASAATSGAEVTAEAENAITPDPAGATTPSTDPAAAAQLASSLPPSALGGGSTATITAGPARTAAAAGASSPAGTTAAKTPAKTTTKTTTKPAKTTAPAAPTTTTTTTAAAKTTAKTTTKATTKTTAKPAPKTPDFGIPVTLGPATQLITVQASSRSATTATLRAWEKRANGRWVVVVGPVKAYVGAAGIGQANESVSRTPRGTFTLTEAFGRLKDPGTALPYHRTGPNDWWVSDTKAASYNTMVTCAKAACPFNTAVSERLQYITPYYDYAVVMDVNRSPAVPGAGSAFFLHVSVGTATQGCVAIDTSSLVTILRWLDPAAHPRIATGIG